MCFSSLGHFLNRLIMRNILFLCCLGSFLLLAAPTASAKPQIPEGVLKAFQAKFPAARDVDWEVDNKTEYEAEFELNGTEMSASFDAAGKWLETETEIRLTDLPAPVQAALQGKKVKEAAKIERADGSTVYEAEVKRKDLLLDAAGKLLPEEKD